MFSHYMDSHSVPAAMEDSRRLEKILAHYIDTINSVSFDSDTKLADICTQTKFVPLGYLFERFLAVPASSTPVESFFLRVFSNIGLIVRQHREKMSDCLLESFMFAKCSIFSWLLWTCIVIVNVRGVANFMTKYCQLFGVYCLALSLTSITYPFIHKLTKCS